MEEDYRQVSIVRNPWRWGIYLLAGLLFLGWILNTPPGLLGKADAVGYAVCHRIDARSFHLGNRQLPLCVRCSGQYLGALFGILFLGSLGKRRAGTPPKSVITILVLFFLVYAVDGVNSYFHLDPMLEMFPSFPRLYEPSNVIRLVTGTGMGFSISVVIFLTFNRSIWIKYDRKPVIENLKQLSIAILSMSMLDLLILTENPVILFPLSVISALSVVLLLSVVYSLVIVTILRLENRIVNIAQYSLPLILGFMLAMAQLALFDALRYLLTGTWEGFLL